MEMKPIPDYPNYAVTRDGRVWSHYSKKFICLTQKKGYGSEASLHFDGIIFHKGVHRLVFEAFHGYAPEVVSHKDGNIFNNHLDNLEALTMEELARKPRRRVERPRRKIVRVDIKSGETTFIRVARYSRDYGRIQQALHRRAIASRGAFYYYEGEKEELVAEIKARIKSNELTLKYIWHFAQGTSIKNHIAKHKKYLKILEKI